MSPRQVSARDRLLAITLLVALLAGGIVLAGGTGYVLFDRQRDHAAWFAGNAARLERVLANQRAKQQMLQNLDQREFTGMIFITAPSYQSAVAQLQDRVNSLATTSGTTLRRITATDRRGDDTLAGVQLEVFGNLPEITQFMISVETGRPIMWIQDFTITRLRLRPPRTGDAGDGEAASYAASFTVLANVRSERDG